MFEMSLVIRTRLHSSRMRTARALTVSPSMLWWVGGSQILGGFSILGEGFSNLGEGGSPIFQSWGGLLPTFTEADPPVSRILDTRH